MQTNAKSKGNADIVSAVVHSVVQPTATTIDGICAGVSDWTANVFSHSDIVAKSRLLSAEVRAQAGYQEEISRLNQEITSLRKALGLPELVGKVRIPADVIGFFPSENRITISAGKSEQVRAGLPVITGDGLLGVVQIAEAHTSQVTLIYAPTLRIGAVAQRDPPAAGLLQGESSSKLVLEFVDLEAPVQNGDLVVTSGFSERIPGGIPIGKIVQISDDKEFGTRRAQIYPNVQIGSVREVFVLR